MRKAKFLGLVLLLGLFTVSMTAYAGSGGRAAESGKGHLPMPPGKWWKMPKAVEEFSLTQDEQEELDRMYLEQRRRMIDSRGELQKERLELEQLIDSRIFDKSACDKSACMESFKKVQQATNKLGMERFKFLVQVRELLGFERFQQLKTEFRRQGLKQRQGRQKSY